MIVSLEDVGARLEGGSRLTDSDARALMASSDILAIGMLADEVRRKRHGDRTTFVRVADVALHDESDPSWPAAAGEVRVVGTPGPLDAACRRVKQLVIAAGRTPVSAFSLADLELQAVEEHLPLADLLRRFREAGLELIADAPLDRLQNPGASLEAVCEAGLVLARCTVAGARGAPPEGTVRLAVALQDATHCIRTFAPLPRIPLPGQPSTGYEDVKLVSLARLLADNIDSIQVDWALYGPKLAQVALTFGADDVDGVSAEDDETLGPRRRAGEEIRRNIRAAAQTPVERNGRFALMAT